MSPKARRASSRGYTLLEVMIAISILAVASTGIFAMQKVATFGNLRARNLAMGTHLAQTWVERLRTDATRWNYPSPSLGSGPGSNQLINTLWLQKVASSPNVWFRPNDIANAGSAGFDALGNDVPATRALDAVYCTHLRLNWTFPPTPGGATSSGSLNLVRAEVRVFWKREGGAALFGASVCDPNQATTPFDSPALHPVQRYHFVYLTTSVAANTIP